MKSETVGYRADQEPLVCDLAEVYTHTREVNAMLDLARGHRFLLVVPRLVVRA